MPKPDWPGPILNLDPKEMGEAITTVRKNLGISQRELAKRLGIHESQISRYEKSGYAGVALHRLDEIFAAMGTSVHTHIVAVGDKDNA